MALSFVNCNACSNHPLVHSVINEIQSNNELFIYVARIFDNFKESNQNKLGIIDDFITSTFNNANLQCTAEKKNTLILLFKSIYRDADFEIIRSGVLEYVVYLYGPFAPRNSRSNVYVEPNILDNGIIVGVTNNRCDTVFHEIDTKPIELVECKSNIFNFFPANISLNDPGYKAQKRQQVLYLVNVYNHLTMNYCEPDVYVACYNTNYIRALHNVHKNWGYSFFKCISPQEILNSIIARKAV
jgi:hypothetical protein